MITAEEVRNILEKDWDELVETCKELAVKYQETLDGDTRILYNNLYAFLYAPVSYEKKAELYNLCEF